MISEIDREAQEEILELEKKFGEAMIQNDTDAIGRLLSNDWIIIDPDGSVIDRSRFLAVIRSGALKHEAMDSEDIRYAPTGTLLLSPQLLTLGRNIWRKNSIRMRELRTFSRDRMGGGSACSPTSPLSARKSEPIIVCSVLVYQFD